MQVKIQGGRKIRRLRHHQHQHLKSQYKYQTKKLTDNKHEKYLQHKKHVYRHMSREDILSPAPSSLSASSVSEQIKIVSAPHTKKHKNHKLHQQHLQTELHVQQLLPSQPPLSLPLSSSSSYAPSYAISRQRKKRSISSPRHVETLIVADSTMVVFHDDIETYLLTIMNMVSALYKDPSIGNAIEIVVVRIILLDDDETQPNLNLTQNAQQNLDTFCR